MGLFYKTPSDLTDLESLVLAVGQEMGRHGRGHATPGLLQEMATEAAGQMQRARARLLEEGRQKDLKAWRKHLLSVGRYLDNAVYNALYQPFVQEHLAD